MENIASNKCHKIRWEENKKKRDNLTRKRLISIEKYALDGVLDDATKFGIPELLFYGEIQNIEEWNRILNEVLPVKDYIGYGKNYDTENDFYIRLQEAFLKWTVRFNFHPVDQANIFKAVFGDTYDPDAVFPIKIPGESELKKISLSADCIFSHLLHRFCQALDGDSESEYSLNLIGYMESCIPHISKKGIHVDAPSDHEYWGIHHSFKVIISKSLDATTEITSQKNQYAKDMRKVFDRHLGEHEPYMELVKEVTDVGFLSEATSVFLVRGNMRQEDKEAWVRFLNAFEEWPNKNRKFNSKCESELAISQTFEKHVSRFIGEGKKVGFRGRYGGDDDGSDLELKIWSATRLVDIGDNDPEPAFVLETDRTFLTELESALKNWLDLCPVENVTIEYSLDW